MEGSGNSGSDPEGSKLDTGDLEGKLGEHTDSLEHEDQKGPMRSYQGKPEEQHVEVCQDPELRSSDEGDSFLLRKEPMDQSIELFSVSQEKPKMSER